ncbi:glycosyltransferase [Clostridium perfringens]|uniref:glycosyltransferase n=1 Tax=Clostridium perfringens TaxID=1502 RepID=UPI000D70A392|nr:glycosyltransferase [Clostridium perfringens]EGT3602716.1 glycosyltransferase family 4 protein [Clostridium perfringens]EHR9038724.1 glycosyltransferase [Clostridium perfringens]NGT79679.1 glycosyltransferase family 4 protein [Clostridium perfringens]PWX48081.1 hypothetical protein CYK61_12510 [Clostridium perfringens]UBK98193.1 glycosyltransferase [Clostridium perfringens]
MKVLYIVHDSNVFGGANMALLELIDSLDKTHFEALVLVPDINGNLIRKLEENKIRYIVFPYGWCAFHKSNNEIRNFFRYSKLIIKQLLVNFKIKKLIKLIENENIDLIHSNSSVVNIGAILSRKMKIKHIWHIREFGEEHLNMRFMFGKKITRKYMVSMCDKMIFISKALYSKYFDIVKSDKMLVVYDGVSSKYNNFNEKKSNNGVLNIIQVANIQKGKGQYELVKAVEELINEKRNIYLHIVGDIGEFDYYNKVKAVSDKYNNIKLYGKVNDIEYLNELRKNSDCEVICSYMEAFGRVTVEAMLSCLPIIASDSGANKELINNNVNGLKYEIYNKYDLKEKIAFFMDNKIQRISMGKRGYELAINNYTSSINAKKIEEIYNLF